MASVGQWCKEHWELVVTVVLVIAAITVLVLTAGMSGPLMLILAGACKGLVAGALLGGIFGGLNSYAKGGSVEDIIKGFEDGAFQGALMGALFGGLGGVGEVLGEAGKLGTSCTVMKNISTGSGIISLGMALFDTAALAAELFAPGNAFTAFNHQLHQNSIYNGFQITVTALAVFTGGAAKGMDRAGSCFVAGTMILTAAGLVAIENIRRGDKVISTNLDSFEVAEKSVLETYIREVTELIHLTINAELITTTIDHPFYVKNTGFVSAGELRVGSEVINSQGEVLTVEDIRYEAVQTPVTVYNFQVEDFHTYHVGLAGVLVHNAEYVDGQRMTTNEALDAAQDFLGDNSINMGNDRYVSADGTRQVRMGDTDIEYSYGIGTGIY